MRIRACAAAVSCAAVVSTALIPATAQAANGAATGQTVFSNVVVDGGKDIVLGLSTRKTVTITWKAADPDGLAASWAYLWHGPDTDDADGILPLYPPRGTCAVPSAGGASTCKVSFEVDSRRDFDDNALAGTWNVLAEAQDAGDDWTAVDIAGTAHIKRAAKVTVNASPEPVRKGRTITVTGSLTRADWKQRAYTGYQGRSVTLQFRKKGSTTYTTVKTVTSGSRGRLRTTVKATTDGYFRFVFSGSTTTGPATAAGDFVDVR